MKVPISAYDRIDLEAPVLPAYETRVNGSTRRLVWCAHCRVWHRHVPGGGHREAHCKPTAAMLKEPDHWPGDFTKRSFDRTSEQTVEITTQRPSSPAVAAAETLNPENATCRRGQVQRLVRRLL